MASVLDAPPPSRRSRSWLAGGGAVVVHAGLVALAAYAGARAVHEERAPASELLVVELPPPPTPAPVLPEATPAGPPAPARAARRDAPRAAPPPAAAQAAPAVTAKDEIVDFGDELVVGTGTSHAGGTTEAGGTSTEAVRASGARAGGVEGGTGTTPGGDASRPPQLAGGAEWDCPFPREAEDAGVHRAEVVLRVEVDAQGGVRAVHASSDPGHGFAREARRCARSKRWSAGLDRTGRPVDASVQVVVTFQR